MKGGLLFALSERGPMPLPAPAQVTDFAQMLDGLPLGIYSALRTFEHDKFLDLDEHIARTLRSVVLLGWDYQLDEIRLRRALDQVVRASPWPDARVRFDLLAQPLRIELEATRELIALLPLQPWPAHFYAEGVIAITSNALKRQSPLVKEAQFARQRQKLIHAAGPDVHDVLLLDDQQRILEGTMTNFWAVRDGRLYTAGEGVLEGVTRKIILELAGSLGITVRLQPVGVADLPSLDEAALTSSSRGFLPLVKIDDVIIGDGRPGPFAKRIHGAYKKYLTRAIKPALANGAERQTIG